VGWEGGGSSGVMKEGSLSTELLLEWLLVPNLRIY